MSKNSTKATEGSKNIKLTEERDNIFIDAMLEQQTMGFRVDGTFTSTAYRNMLAICMPAFDIRLTKDNLKNRMKILKTHFTTCNEMFKHKSGISWNSETEMFEAEEAVWDDIILANPQLRRWKGTPVHNFDKLEMLFSKDRAIGNLSGTCGELTNMLTNEDVEDVPLVGDFQMPYKNIAENIPFDIPPTQPGTDATEDSIAHRSGNKRKHRKNDDVTASALLDLVHCIKDANQSFKEAVSTPATEVAKEHREGELIQELQRIGVPRHLIVDAYVTLGSSKDKTRVFFSALEEMRLEVLTRLMGS